VHLLCGAVAALMCDNIFYRLLRTGSSFSFGVATGELTTALPHFLSARGRRRSRSLTDSEITSNTLDLKTYTFFALNLWFVRKPMHVVRKMALKPLFVILVIE
jgi:hypothetical protein